ncbi:MAG: bifunctional salicylyl-CoA 5-hydroxylase/oxidoreductase [Acidobacteria bacterium]|nr:bifunctional salicylyl-CoA 5-hydroxylase/oxidoreductase [Acidobacteriota bacterium]
MRIHCLGGGPAGLYFAILMKRRRPECEVVVWEQNRVEDTFGFGVVFSDATMDNLEAADPESWRRVREAFYRWDDIHIHYRGDLLESTGHGFAGMSRMRLLEILSARAQELGAEIRFGTTVNDPRDLADADLVVAGDGLHSPTREQFAEHFKPTVDMRPNRFVWLGTTCPFPAFTFDFVENDHGLWRLHAYQYEPRHADPDDPEPISTFIVEATDETFARAGLEINDENATIAYCQELFAERLGTHRLIANKSIWRQFPTVRNERWSHDNFVLVGDAVHTAHFSIGSGTKLAMEDSIALVDHIDAAWPAGGPIPAPERVTQALEGYQADRRPDTDSLQRAAQVSLQWFEDTERYWNAESIEFGFSLLTRSLRITHADLAERDPLYVDRIDHWFADQAAAQSGVAVEAMSALPEKLAPDVHSPAREYVRRPVPPPMFTPFKLREMTVANRVVVSPMCQYSATDGLPDEWHFVHLGSRALGGAGLIVTEMTDISPDARITPGCTGLYNDEQVDAWRRVLDFVHANSYSKVAVQLAHAGRKGSTKLAWEGNDAPLEDGWPLLAPSPIPWHADSPVPHEMTRADMDEVRDLFVAATERAAVAGFDMCELHMAHGYLLSTFISPLTNERDDEFGGSLENRMRYPLEVFRAMRAAWPDERPMSVRISAVDWAPGGMEPADSVEVARMLKSAGCDLVDVSAGQTVPHARPVYGRQFQTPFAERIRREVGIHTMAVGNISSYMDVNTILAAGRADLCALARAHLWDPYWTRNAAQKQGWDLPWPDAYSVLDRYRPRFE